jgi:putative membrane protein
VSAPAVAASIGASAAVHDHDAGGLGIAWLVVAFLAISGVVYLVAAGAERSRGRRAWPWHRDASWVAGLVVVAITLVGPLAAAAHRDLGAHMVAHVLAGMLAPLLLVASAPLTLAFRSLHPVPARRLSRLLGSRAVRFVMHPVVASLLNVGSLWLLYATPLASAMRDVPLVHELVIVHVLLAGFLFTASIVPVDPSPHRASFPLRLVVLVLAIAAHSVLAKRVFAGPPAGATIAEARGAGLVMYYGGDALELVLLVAFFAQWYRAAGRRLAPAPAAPAPAAPSPAAPSPPK